MSIIYLGRLDLVWPVDMVSVLAWPARNELGSHSIQFWDFFLFPLLFALSSVVFLDFDSWIFKHRTPPLTEYVQ